MAAIELYSTSLYSDSNLKVYYRLEADGTDAEGSFTATGTGPSFAAGKFNNAMIVAGSSTYSATDSSSVLAMGTNFSLVAWVYSSNNSVEQYMCGKYSSGSNAWFVGGGWGGGWNLTIRDSSFGGSNPSIWTSGIDNNWHHIAVVKSGNNVTFYVDGSSGGTCTTAYTGIGGNSKLSLGWAGTPDGSQPWHGGIDDLAIFDRALTSTEVSNLYTGSGWTTARVHNLGTLGVGS